MNDEAEKSSEDKDEQEKYNGWIIIDKPQGITSADVVRRIKNKLGKAKVGHAGTLDPLATGVLPIALGCATKMMPYLSDTGKEYDFVVKWGQSTDSCDADGQITDVASGRPSVDEIQAVLPKFKGKLKQTPPVYSAVKVGGQRAYDLARKGKDVKLEAREIEITSLQLLPTDKGSKYDSEDYAAFKVICSSGTYVRSLARDLAESLGTLGHIVSLRRRRSGKFTIQDAILLETFEQIEHLTPRSEIIIPADTVLDDISVLALTEIEARTLVSGNPIPALPLLTRNNAKVTDSLLFRMTYKDRFIVLAQLQGAAFRPARVLVNSIDE